MAYPFLKIEKKWQNFWEENKTFKTDDSLDISKPKFYVLDMFPYPSGAGLHVGHPEGYTATDIVARYKRLNGYNVLHPMGWDAFGLPAEQYAIETGTHPAVTTQKNISRFRDQLKMLGFSYDWDRQIDTTDPNYFKWTQWIFLQLYKRGLAYIAEVPVNWCPALGTVLANEEIIDGRSERGNHPVFRRPMRQWMLKITEYAERLLSDLNLLDWPESTKEMQRNWIGKSEGAEISFHIQNSDKKIDVFTTRPDTIFGATYMVLAPEHPLVNEITTPGQLPEVTSYIESSSRKSDLERTELARKKSGRFTGGFALNPVTGEPIPIWIADYVLLSYGTGAIMAVPGQDERDWEFAELYNLPIIRTVQPPLDFSGKAYTGDGPAINSAFINGLHIEAAKNKMIEYLEDKGVGKRKTNYKLRDWLFSRQRYWGEPFPIIYDQGNNPQAIDETELPLFLPEMTDFRPDSGDTSHSEPQPPLSRAEDSWKFIEKDGIIYRREINTMPQWAGSCWYYLRFIDPHNEKALLDKQKEDYWMPVDLYVGGAEHSVLHLLYARFWHKVLFDLGVVSTKEPFQKLVHQGMILGETEYHLFMTKDGEPISADLVPAGNANDFVMKRLNEEDVEKTGDKLSLKGHPHIRIDSRAFKMSKSRGNVINPDDIILKYGADALRLYEMFMGPLKDMKSWSMRGVEGVYRFLNRVWRLVIDEETDIVLKNVQDVKPSKEQQKQLHQMINKVTTDINEMAFNTSIAAMMTFTNEANKWEIRPVSIVKPFLILLNPFAPHMTEELWQRLGFEKTISFQEWPVFHPEFVKDEYQQIMLQVNGKLRGEMNIEPQLAMNRDVLLEKALQEEIITKRIEGKRIIKKIAVPGKLVNIVVE